MGAGEMNAKGAANTIAVNSNGTVLKEPSGENCAASGNDNEPPADRILTSDFLDASDRENPRYVLFGKRLLDLAGAVALLVFFAPLMLIVYLAVRMDGGPGIYAHERVGKNGVRFMCYKFRSMVPNADQVLKDILVCNEQFRQDWEADQKLRNDPRITRIGVFLRQKSLDELPQLFNVLKGDMSLVGPRPITVDEMERYGREISFYLKTRPGLTGAWQVSGRNDTTYQERIALDVAYTKNRTFVNDFLILLKTVRVVISGRGAL